MYNTYSCTVVSVFLFGGKPNLVLLTLIYSTLLALTDRQTDRGTNTLASRGLEEPAHASRGFDLGRMANLKTRRQAR